jgi:uncharacterized membrane protein
MFVCQLFVWFVLYSIVGWIWESAYCTVIEHKWQNRGFLYGPYCPIYGTGIVGIMLLWHTVLERGETPAWYQVFLVVMVGSAILEYATHWALEKLFHAYWWDYSNMPLNLNGRICLPASVFFGLGGLLVVYVLYGPTTRLITSADPLATELFSLVLMAIIAADTAITASSLASIARTASNINRSVNAHMDRFVAKAEDKRQSIATEISEQREQAAQAIRDAGESLRGREEAIYREAEDQERERSQRIAQERERFASRVRRRQLNQMGAAARLAAQRAKGAVTSIEKADLPGYDQLTELWHDLLEKN